MSANDRQVGGAHYKRGIQHWDYVLSKDMPYLEAQVVKYVERWSEKNGLQDLEKAGHFLQKLIEHNFPDTKVSFEVTLGTSKETSTATRRVSRKT